MNRSTPDVKNRCGCNGPGCPDCNIEVADAVGLWPTERPEPSVPTLNGSRSPEHTGVLEVGSDERPKLEGSISQFAGEPAVSHNRGAAPGTAIGLSGNSVSCEGPAVHAVDRNPHEENLTGESSVSRGHGVQGDPATAASCTTLALETAAGIQLEELAEVCGEGETGWNAQRRNDIARKMQRIAANCPNRYSEDELLGTVVRAERGELR